MKKFYYGWIVLAALTLIYFASNGYGYLSIPVFYPKLTEFFQVQKGEVPQAAFIMSLILAFLAPIIGVILDKFNPKILFIFGVFLIISMQFYFTKIVQFQDLKIFNIGYAVALVSADFCQVFIFWINGLAKIEVWLWEFS